jgi:hypothetical protein
MFMERAERQLQEPPASAQGLVADAGIPLSTGPERTRMPPTLAARSQTLGHRGRVIAPLVGVLALVLAVFVMTAPADATAGHGTKPPAGKPASAHMKEYAVKAKGDHKPDKPKDNNQPPAPDCKPGEVVKYGKCVPQPECKPGEVVKYGKCVPQPECKPGEVVKNGMCIPAEECKPPNHVENGQCVPPTPPNECTPPQVPQNGQCVTPPTQCTPPAVPQNGQCVTPPATPGTGQPAPPAPAPAGTTAPATTTATPAPNAAQPTTVVAGTQARQATARLQTQTRCGSRSFRVTISGRNIRRVTLFVAGRQVRTVTVPAGRRSITVSVPVRQFGARRQSVRARVTFRNGAPARTLTASATRCAQTSVSPQFTG